MGFRSYLLKRLFYAVVVLFVILTFNYVLFRIMPGDSREDDTRPQLHAEAKMELRRQYGLDDPPLTQYLNYMKSLLTFDLGMSFQYAQAGLVGAERAPSEHYRPLHGYLRGHCGPGHLSGRVVGGESRKFSEQLVMGAGLFAHAVRASSFSCFCCCYSGTTGLFCPYTARSARLP